MYDLIYKTRLFKLLVAYKDAIKALDVCPLVPGIELTQGY